jgi:hypothetical protein
VYTYKIQPARNNKTPFINLKRHTTEEERKNKTSGFCEDSFVDGCIAQNARIKQESMFAIKIDIFFEIFF